MPKEPLSVDGVRQRVRTSSLQAKAKGVFLATLDRLQTREAKGLDITSGLQVVIADFLKKLELPVAHGTVGGRPVRSATPDEQSPVDSEIEARASWAKREHPFATYMMPVRELLDKTNSFLDKDERPSNRRPLTKRKYNVLLEQYADPVSSGRNAKEATYKEVAESSGLLYAFIESHLSTTADSALAGARVVLLDAADEFAEAFEDAFPEKREAERKDSGAPGVRTPTSTRSIVDPTDPRAVAALNAYKKTQKSEKSRDPYAGQVLDKRRTSQVGGEMPVSKAAVTAAKAVKAGKDAKATKLRNIANKKA